MAGKVAHKKIYTPVCPPVDAQANGLPLGNEITSQYGATRVLQTVPADYAPEIQT